jgi:fibronectin-binding autotransporter adhesin
MRCGNASYGRRRAVMAAAMAAALAAGGPAFAANTELDVTNGATDLTAAGSFNQATPPGPTSDITFLANTTYAPTTFSIGPSLSIGTLNDLDTTQTLTITNPGGSDATLTLNGGGDSVLGTNPADLLFVAAGGTLVIQNGPTNALNLALGAAGNFDIAGTATIASGISGSFGFTKTGSGTLTLTGANTYTGATTLSSGTLALNFASDNTNKLSTGGFTMSGGTLSLTGNASAATSQSLGGFTLNGGGAIVVNSGSGQSVALNLGAITRTVGGDFDITANGVGGGTATVTTTNANASFTGGQQTILGGYATFGGGSTWAVSAGDGTNPGAIGGLSAYSSTFTAGTDVDAAGALAPAAMTINSLRFNSNAGATTVTSSGAITIATGGILVTPTVGNNAVTIAGSTLATGNGTDLIVNQYNTANTLTISSVIAGGAAGLTKSGPGTLILTGANTFTGDINLNGGVLQYQQGTATTTSALGVTSGTVFKRVILTNGATFRVAVNSYNDNVPSTTNIGAGQVFLIGAGGGTFDVASGLTFTVDDGSGNGVATTNSELQGSGDLTLKSTGTTGTNTGTVALGNGTSNFSVFTGQIFITSNVTVTTGNGAFPLGSTSAGTFVLSGGVLNLNGQSTVGAEPLTLNGTGIGGNGALINGSATASSNSTGPITLASATSVGGAGALTLNGVISGAAPLTKVGAGVLSLGEANLYTGGTTVSSGTLSLANTSGSAVGPGNVTLNPTGGANLTSGPAGSMTGTVFAATGGTSSIIGPGGIYAGGTLATVGTLTVGGLQLTSNATTLNFDLSTPSGSNDQLIVTGLDALTAAGPNKVPITIGLAPAATGTYHLVSFNQDGSGTIGLNSFALGPAGFGRLTYGLQLNSGGGNQKFLDLVVTGNATPITANFIGMSASGSWTTAPNWDSNPVLPGLAGDVVTFNNGASTPGTILVTLDGPQHVGSLTFNNSGTTAFNLAAGTNPSLAPGLFFDNTPNAPAAATLSETSDNNTISAPVSIISPTNVTITGTTAGLPDVLTISGALNGTAGLTLTNTSTGTLVLSGANGNFSGGVTVAGGTARAGSGSALGTAAATVTAGGTLDLGGQTITTPLVLNGAGLGGAGALVNNSGTTGIDSGTVNLASATTIGGSGAITLSGVVSGSGALTKIGGGNLTLSTNANTNTGAVTINGGTLTLSGASGGTGTIQAPSITVNAGGTLVLTNQDTLGFSAGRNVLTINSGGIVLNNGTARRDTFQNTLTMTGGTLGGTSAGDSATTNGGAYSFNTANALVATSDALGNPAVINPTGGVSLQTNAIFTVNAGLAAPMTDLLVASPIIPYAQGSNGLTKTGNGVMTLTAANTYAGPTAVNLGTLSLNNVTGTVLGATAVTVGNGAAITPTAGNATLLVRGNNTVGTATAGSMTISGGDGTTLGQGTLSLVDGAINTLTFTNRTAAGTSLTVGSASNPGVLNVELGTAAGSIDQIVLGANDGFVLNAGGGVVNIIPTGAIVNGTYTLISYGSLAGGGVLVFSNGQQTETLGGATLTLAGGPTAQTLTISNSATGPVPTAAWFQGNFSSNWATIDGSGNTNFTTDAPGATNAQQVPGAATDVHLYAGNANTGNLATTLGENFTIKSLTVDGGALSQNVSIAGGGGTLTITPATSTAGITVNSGAGAVMITAPVALGAAQTWTNNAASTLTVGGPITNGANALTVAGSGTVAISGGIGNGSGALITAGTGIVQLSGTNLYTGATAVNSGTLQLAASNALPANTALTIGSGTSVGTLDLNGFNQTVGSLGFRSNTALVNTVTIPAASTLTVNGTFNLGPSPAADGITTKATFSGGGALVVNAPASTLDVGLANTNQNNAANTSVLDLSGLGSLTANVANFRVGFGSQANATLDLSNTSNSITANLFSVGDTNGNNGGPANVVLGTGTNAIAADTINVGLSKAASTIKFASQTAGSPGTITITNRAGTGGATMTLGSHNGTSTGAGFTATLDLRGHVANVTAGAVTLGNSNGTGTGAANGLINFDTGTFSATSVTLGLKSSSGANTSAGGGTVNVSGGQFSVSGTTTFATDTGTTTTANTGSVTGTLAVSGGTFTTGSIVGATKTGTGVGTATANINVSGGALNVNPGGSFVLATQSGSGSAVGNLSLTGGSVTSNADITNGGGATTTTITVNGGTLDLVGHQIGGATSISTLNFQSGTLRNVAEINAGAPLVKTTAGTLALSGNNTYAGGTNVNAGLLLANTSTPGQSSTGSGAVAVNSGGALAGGLGTTPGYIASAAGVNAVTVNSGGTISAGNGTSAPGLLVTTGGNGTTTFTHTWNAGGTYAWHLNTNNAGATQPISNGTSDAGGAGANWGMISLQTLNLPSSGQFTINIVPVTGAGSNGFNPAGTYQWTIADISGTGSAPGVFQGGTSVSQGNYAALVANTFVLNTTALTTAFPTASGVFSLGLVNDGTANGQDLVVSYSSAPEPTALALTGLAAGGLLLGRRRRRIARFV